MSIRPERMLVLSELRRGDATPSEIADRIAMLEPLANRLLELLVMEGLAEPQDPPNGSLPTRYRITAGGLSLLDNTERPLT